MHSLTHAIAFGRIIVVPVCAYVCNVTTVINEQWQSLGRQRRSELHHQGEFLHNYYTFESMHDDGVVRIFLGLSCEP